MCGPGQGDATLAGARSDSSSGSVPSRVGLRKEMTTGTHTAAGRREGMTDGSHRQRLQEEEAERAATSRWWAA
jgi:hypothetical protein